MQRRSCSGHRSHSYSGPNFHVAALPCRATHSNPCPYRTTRCSGTLDPLTETALGYLTQLLGTLGARESASEEEAAAAEYLSAQFAELGYSVELHPFSVERLSLDESGLMVRSENPSSGLISVEPLSGSGFGEAVGALVSAGLGLPEDFPDAGLQGKIALVERGFITFELKARNVREAGAVGLVIYNNVPGNFQGQLGFSADIPVVAVSRTDGQELKELATTQEVDATLALRLEEVPSRNVIAEKVGTGEGVVVLGAHYDTIPGVVGANDNASGTAAILTIAGQLSDQTFPFTVRFIAFGSEELGLLGSLAYVDSLSEDQRSQIIAMLNFDTVGSGSGLRILGEPGLTSFVVDSGAQQGIDVAVSAGLPGASSDHASFWQAGVPAVMFFSDDSSRIHTPQDTLESINPRLLGEAAQLGLDLLDFIADQN